MKSSKLICNYGIIKRFVITYRKELTDFASEAIERVSKMSLGCDYIPKREYKKFLKSLSDDEFAANYLINLNNESVIGLYEEVLDGTKTIKEFIEFMREQIDIIDC